jgi:NAD(P)-dependent dehydrogenase (short-subunit alcohol dehydrogenase family)
LEEKFLEGKGALITGGASGFGRGVGFEFARRGADIILVDINEQLLGETAKKIQQETKQKVVPIVCDVSNSDQVEAMGKQAFKELDNIYVVFNNAGVGLIYGKSLLRVPDDIWDKEMSINLKGQWLVAKALWRKMSSQKFEPLAGKMIHTASIAGMVADPGIPVYSITKASIIAMVEILAKTLAPKITVNAISPGFHITGIYKNSEEVMKFTMKDGHVKTPLNRIGTVEDVVNLVSFLASPASNFITGHNFPCDGGIAEVGVPPYYLETDI